MKFKSILNRDVAKLVADTQSNLLKKFLVVIYIFFLLFIVGINLYDIYVVSPVGAWNGSIILVSIVAVIVITAVSILRYFLYRKKISRTLLNQIDVTYHTDSVERDCEIQGDKLIVTREDTTKEFLLSDIAKVKEYEEDILIFLRGNLLVPVKKATIEGGTSEELLKIVSRQSK